MLLFELFDDTPDVTGDIKSVLMDILTPFVAAQVPFITIQNIIDKMSEARTGLTIDRSLILDLLDPEKVKMVDKIEGDRIYLSSPEADERAVDKEDGQKEKDHVSDLATKQSSADLGDGPL